MNKKNCQALVQQMREAGYEAHLITHGSSPHRKTYSALLVPYGTFFHKEDFEKWQEKRENERRAHEHE